MKEIALVLPLLLSAGCARSIAYIMRLDCDQMPGRHFPDTTWDTWEENLVSAHLRELGEPALYRRFAPDQVVRLTITPHDSAPVAITLVTDERAPAVRVSYYDGAGGWCPSDLPKRERSYPTQHVTESVSQAEVFAVLRQLDAFDFWSRSTTPEDHPEGIICLHSTHYVLESRDGGRYHHLYRDSCNPTVGEPLFVAICRQLLAHSPEAIRDAGYCP